MIVSSCALMAGTRAVIKTRVGDTKKEREIEINTGEMYAENALIAHNMRTTRRESLIECDRVSYVGIDRAL